MSARADIILAFDVGTKKTGIAVGNRISGGSRPLAVIYGDRARQLAQIADYIQEWCPGVLVVGLPVHIDGTAHRMTARARRFADSLRQRFSLPVMLADERESTRLARLCRTRRTEAGRDSTTNPTANPTADVDAAAAAVILQCWLDSGDSGGGDEISCGRTETGG